METVDANTRLSDSPPQASVLINVRKVWPVATLLVASCAALSSLPPEHRTQPVPLAVLSGSEKNIVEESVRKHLSDRQGAEFWQMVAKEGPDGLVMVCGMVRTVSTSKELSKYEPFHGLLFRPIAQDLTSNSELFVPLAVGGHEDEQRITLKICSHDGLILAY
jgi:hypothetical protein